MGTLARCDTKRGHFRCVEQSISAVFEGHRTFGTKMQNGLYSWRDESAGGEFRRDQTRQQNAAERSTYHNTGKVFLVSGGVLRY